MHWMGLASDLEYLNASVCSTEGWTGQGAVVKANIGVKVEGAVFMVEGTLSKEKKRDLPFGHLKEETLKEIMNCYF